MPAKPNWDRLSPFLLRLYQEIEPENHARAMLSVLQELVGADSIVLNQFEVTTGRYTVVTLPDGLAKPDEVALVGRWLHQSPFPPYFVATGDSQWKMTTDFMPVEDFHATELWQQGLSRWGINQQCCGMLAFLNNTAHALTINRKDRGFTEDERALLNSLHPHLVTSYVNAQAFATKVRSLDELRTALDAAPGAYGYVRSDGSLSWLQPEAKTWLNQMFISPTRDQEDLPTDVRELIEQARSAKNETLHLSRKNESFRYTLCLLPSPLGGWIIRLERSPRNTQLKLKPVAGLTDRENEVLRWMVEGKRNSEIASILDISSRTVEKHAASILRAMDVENRATAIIRAMELSAG